MRDAYDLETVYVIVMRYVFNNTPHWGEIISRFLMVYASMFGFSIGIHDDSLVGIKIVDQWLPKGVLHILDWFAIFCMTAFSIFMIVEGIRYTILCEMYLVMLFVLVIVNIFPETVLFLPRLLMKLPTHTRDFSHELVGLML